MSFGGSKSIVFRGSFLNRWDSRSSGLERLPEIAFGKSCCVWLLDGCLCVGLLSQSRATAPNAFFNHQGIAFLDFDDDVGMVVVQVHGLEG